MHILHNPLNFESVFHQYKEKIYNYVLAIVKSAEHAEEVTQEIFIKLWLCREMLEQVENLDGFIYVIARNKALDHLRKAAYDVRLLNELKSFIPDEQNNVDSRMAVEDYQLLVHQALNVLSPQRLKVYQLSRKEGLNHDEIAEKLQLSKSTVKNHLVEALRLIRNHLYKNGASLSVFLIFLLS